VAVTGGPQQEGADGLALVGQVGSVVGVDVGFGESGWVQVVVSGPGEERFGLGEPGPGLLAGGGAQRRCRLPAPLSFVPSYRRA
jgi:hypothetical protein